MMKLCYIADCRFVELNDSLWFITILTAVKTILPGVQKNVHFTFQI